MVLKGYLIYYLLFKGVLMNPEQEKKPLKNISKNFYILFKISIEIRRIKKQY